MRAHVSTAEPAFPLEGPPLYFVSAAPPENCAGLAQILGLAVTPQFRAIQAQREDTGEVVGMVGFDRWTDNAVELHVWFSKPNALRALLTPAFQFAFEQNGKGVALGVVGSLNSRALEMDKHLGFEEVARIKDGKAPGEDLVLLQLRKENCKWLKRDLRKAA